MTMTTYDYDCDCDPCFQTGPFISSGEKQFQSIEPQKNLHGSHETLPLKVFIKKKKCTGTYMIKEYPKNQDRPNKAGQTECVGKIYQVTTVCSGTQVPVLDGGEECFAVLDNLLVKTA